MEKSQKEVLKELKILYKKWPSVRHFLSTYGCHEQNAEDIFQEALLIYVRKKEDPSFHLSVEPFFYVRNVCKLLWYNQQRKQGNLPTYDLERDVASIEDEWFEKEMKLSIVEKAIEQLGEQCQQLLHMFYVLGLKMVDIAEKIGLRNEKVAKTQKYRCIQKAKEHAESLEVESPLNVMS